MIKYIGEKNGLLHHNEVCEYTAKCNQECQGKNPERNNKFSCGQRRGLLMVDGYKVIYGQ